MNNSHSPDLQRLLSIWPELSEGMRFNLLALARPQPTQERKSKIRLRHIGQQRPPARRTFRARYTRRPKPDRLRAGAVCAPRRANCRLSSQAMRASLRPAPTVSSNSESTGSSFNKRREPGDKIIFVSCEATPNRTASPFGKPL